jgi:hypothetical protein
VEIDGIKITGYSDPVRIGGGASSRVYDVRRDSTASRCALKVLLDGSDERWAAFETERRKLGRLQGHSAIVTIIEVGMGQSGHPFVAMDLYAGSLQDRLDSVAAHAHAFRPDDVATIGITISRALVHAHRGDVFHGDVKPANILYRDDAVALADFGIAGTISLASMPLHGTLYHAAPELLDDADPDDTPIDTQVCDTYSLVSTLYALLAGRAPFQPAIDVDEPITAFLTRLHDDDPPPIGRTDVGPEWRELFRRGLHKDPRHRFESAAELELALRRMRGEAVEPGSATATPVPGGTDAFGRGRRAPAGPTGPAGEGPVTEPPAPAPVSGAEPGGTQPFGRGRRDAVTELPIPPPPDEPEPPRGWTLPRIALAAGVVLLLVVVVALFLLTEEAPLRDDDTDDVVPASTVAEDDLAAGDVVLDETQDPPRVTWTDPTAGQFPFLVVVDSPEDDEEPATVPADQGETSVEVPTVVAGEPWCAMVFTVLDGQGTRTDSDWACINGAIPP